MSHHINMHNIFQILAFLSYRYVENAYLLWLSLLFSSSSSISERKSQFPTIQKLSNSNLPPQKKNLVQYGFISCAEPSIKLYSRCGANLSNTWNYHLIFRTMVTFCNFIISVKINSNIFFVFPNVYYTL